LPGTFEHAVDYLLDHAIDLSTLDARFQNEAIDAPTYPPTMLRRTVRRGYAHGLVSSRDRARLPPGRRGSMRMRCRPTSR
jgi:hypothetical protein